MMKTTNQTVSLTLLPIQLSPKKSSQEVEVAAAEAQTEVAAIEAATVVCKTICGGGTMRPSATIAMTSSKDLAPTITEAEATTTGTTKITAIMTVAVTDKATKAIAIGTTTIEMVAIEVAIKNSPTIRTTTIRQLMMAVSRAATNPEVEVATRTTETKKVLTKLVGADTKTAMVESIGPKAVISKREKAVTWISTLEWTKMAFNKSNVVEVATTPTTTEAISNVVVTSSQEGSSSLDHLTRQRMDQKSAT